MAEGEKCSKKNAEARTICWVEKSDPALESAVTCRLESRCYVAPVFSRQVSSFQARTVAPFPCLFGSAKAQRR
jgi:hypothetical protein